MLGGISASTVARSVLNESKVHIFYTSIFENSFSNPNVFLGDRALQAIF